MKRVYSLVFALFLVNFSYTSAKDTANNPKNVSQIEDDRISQSDSLQVSDEADKILTLSQSIQLALLKSPILSVFSLEIRAKEAAIVQEALYPNPFISIEMENFAGSGSYSSFKSAETTISIGQLIQISGKRKKKAKIASFAAEISTLDYESKRLDVYSNVVIAFNNVLVAQEQVSLKEETLELNTKFKNSIMHLIEAGGASPIEESRAEVEIATTRIELQNSKKKLASARILLASTWGASEAKFVEVQGELDHIVKIPSLSSLKNLLKNNPNLTRWQTVQKQQKSNYNLARAERIPDPSVGIGYRIFNTTNDRALVAAINIPIKIFNRNQGAIEEAEIRLKQSKELEIATQISMQTELVRAYEMLCASRQTIKTLNEEVIPQALQVFEGVNRGFSQGKFRFLDVLDARRMLFSSRDAYLQNLKEYQTIRSTIERLIGQSIENIE